MTGKKVNWAVKERHKVVGPTGKTLLVTDKFGSAVRRTPVGGYVVRTSTKIVYSRPRRWGKAWRKR